MSPDELAEMRAAFLWSHGILPGFESTPNVRAMIVQDYLEQILRQPEPRQVIRIPSSPRHMRGRLTSARRLLEQGPQNEGQIIFWIMDKNISDEEWSKKLNECLSGLWCLWMVRKLWRHSLRIHSQAGAEHFLWGIRGVHPKIVTSARRVG